MVPQLIAVYMQYVQLAWRRHGLASATMKADSNTERPKATLANNASADDIAKAKLVAMFAN